MCPDMEDLYVFIKWCHLYLWDPKKIERAWKLIVWFFYVKFHKKPSAFLDLFYAYRDTECSILLGFPQRRKRTYNYASADSSLEAF